MTEWTTVDYLALTLFLYAWTIISFYGYLPALKNEDVELRKGAEILYFPVVFMLAFREGIKSAYKREV